MNLTHFSPFCTKLVTREKSGMDSRFFSDGTPPRELALVGTKAASSGVVISTYRPSGPLRTGSFNDGAA
jgi:hypothetical protein